jgi:hypothetical protein
LGNHLPVSIDLSLNFSPRLLLQRGLKQMPEAPLRFQILPYWPQVTRNLGVPHLSVNRFLEGPDTGFDRQSSNFIRRTNRQGHKQLVRLYYRCCRHLQP